MSEIPLIDQKFRKTKKDLLKPLIFILDKLKIGADIITTLGLIAGVLAAYLLVTGHTAYSIISLIIHYFLDSIDGTLARYQKKDSDRGKFFDSTVDSIVITLFVAALIYIGKIPGYDGAIFIYLMLVNIVFGAIVYNCKTSKSDWILSTRSGIIVNIPSKLIPILTILWYLQITDLFYIAIPIFNLYLFGTATFNYFRIRKMKKRSR